MSKKGSENSCFIDRVGEIHITTDNSIAKVIEYFVAFDCTIQFEDNTILYKKRYNDLKKGSVKNPCKPIIYNIGYFGIGKYKGSINGKS